jgi:hypothetical protein
MYSVDKLYLLPNDKIEVGDWSVCIKIFDMNQRTLLVILFRHFQGITTIYD